MTAIANLVHQKTVGTGTGALTLTDVAGRRGFYSAFGSGGTDAFFYFISHESAAEWEAGTGHMSDAATLVRDTVLDSSNGGALVNFSAGTKEAVNDLPASVQEKLLQLAAVATSGSYADLSNKPSIPAAQVNSDWGAASGVAQVLNKPVITKPFARKARPRVAFIGSSYTQQQHTVTSGVIMASQSRSWMGWWNAFTGNALNIDTYINASDPLSRGFSGANFGVSGQTSTQILTRVPDVIAKNPDICVLQSGSNNVSSVSTVLDDVKASITLLYAANILPVYLAISFRGSAAWSAANDSQASYINASIRQWLAGNGYGIYVDANRYLCDADSAEGRPYGAALDTDSIHYTTWSAFQVGRVLHECVTPLLSLQAGDVVSNADVYDATYNATGNLWTNPFVSTSTNIGSAAGSVGTGVTAGTGSGSTSVGRDMKVERSSGSGTAVANVESRGPGLGNWQTALFTPAGSGTSLFYIDRSVADLTHGLSAGTWVRAGCMLDLSVFGTDALSSGFQNVMLQADFRDGSSSYGKTQGFAQYSAVSLPNIAWQGAIETPPIRVPTGSDRVRLRLEVVIDDTKAGTGLLKMGSIYFRPCADPSALW